LTAPLRGSELQPEVKVVVDHLFRHEAGKVIAVLVKILGIERLAIAEDVVQETLLKALHQWSYNGIPKSPTAWIIACAKNLALDHLRKQHLHTKHETDLIRLLEEQLSPSNPVDAIYLNEEIADDQLRMMFTCCHPALSKESQIALTLKTLCGFNAEEIARAFGAEETTIQKRLMRARQRAREVRMPFEVPVGEELHGRLSAVLNVLYLLFSEGFHSSRGEDQLRKELCEEAIRLLHLLIEHPVGAVPKAYALLSLMYLHYARLQVVLQKGTMYYLLQEDYPWNSDLVAKGHYYLQQSAQGNLITEYHLEAAILACYTAADHYDNTDWQEILSLYDVLVLINDSPIIALHRILVLAKVLGPEKALKELPDIKNLHLLREHYLFPAIKGELLAQLGEYHFAIEQYKIAQSLSLNQTESAMLSIKIVELEEMIN